MHFRVSRAIKRACEGVLFGPWAVEHTLLFSAESEYLRPYLSHYFGWLGTGTITLSLGSIDFLPEGVDIDVDYLALLDILNLGRGLNDRRFCEEAISTFARYLGDDRHPLPGAEVINRLYDAGDSGQPLRMMVLHAYEDRPSSSRLTEIRDTVAAEFLADFVLDTIETREIMGQAEHRPDSPSPFDCDNRWTDNAVTSTSPCECWACRARAGYPSMPEDDSGCSRDGRPLEGQIFVEPYFRCLSCGAQSFRPSQLGARVWCLACDATQ